MLGQCNHYYPEEARDSHPPSRRHYNRATSLEIGRKRLICMGNPNTTVSAPLFYQPLVVNAEYGKVAGSLLGCGGLTQHSGMERQDSRG